MARLDSPPLLGVLGAVMSTLLACSREAPVQEAPAEPPAVASETSATQDTMISAARLAEHIQILASDEFEGRKPSTPGEEKTVDYIRGQFQALGLAPGNGGSYLQPVPLVSIAADPDITLDIAGGDTRMGLAYGSEMMVWTKRVVDSVSLQDSELVFVGYGIVAPEYDWDDYAGIDMSGKTAVILVNDPGFVVKDPSVFKGHAMTYYGRWTYKYEEAARPGAAGAIIVHETDAAGYPWEVVSGSWSGAQFDLRTEDGNLGRVRVEGWITHEVAERVFQAAGMDYAQAKRSALDRGSFAPAPMGLTASVSIRNTVEESLSNNVIGLLTGRLRPRETLIYMAHWDHLGRDPALEGDQIYNGAVDNATGVAGLLELARAFSRLDPPPERSIVFLALTAEEDGLLGSKYYGTHPIYPLADTVAGLNMDGLNVDGRTRDVAVIGYGSSELEEYLADATRAQNRVVTQEPTPEKGYFYRSDHFNLAKVGVPVLYAESGVDNRQHGQEWGRSRAAEYTAQRYHKPADEYAPSWDLSGAVEDLELYFEIGRRLSMESSFPNWYDGNEFRAARDASRVSASELRPE